MTAELSDTEDEPGLLSSTSPAVLPSVFLYFRHPASGVVSGTADDGDSASTGSDNHMLQIVSKQAHLIDALMQTCVHLNQSGFAKSSSTSTDGILPQHVFGSGVDESSLYSFDWEKEEALLRQDVDDDQCLNMQLERLRLQRAVDYDD